MAKVRNAFSEIFGTVIGCMIALAIYGGLARTTDFASALESRLSPVVAISPSGAIRNDDKACFYLDMHKLADAQPLTYRFFAQTRIASNAEWGPSIPLSVYLVQDDSTERLRDGTLEAHASGQSWRRHYCFEMPSTIADWQEILVTGQAEHRRHPFYSSVTPIPAFRIPPLIGAGRYRP